MYYMYMHSHVVLHIRYEPLCIISNVVPDINDKKNVLLECP